MKLSLLSEQGSTIYGAGIVGSGTLEQDLINAQDPSMFKKNEAEAQRLPSQQRLILPARSGNQDAPMKVRHRRYFNAPSPGTSGKMAMPPESESIGSNDDFEYTDPLEPLDQDAQAYEDLARGLKHEFDDEPGFRGSHVVDKYAARG